MLTDSRESLAAAAACTRATTDESPPNTQLSVRNGSLMSRILRLEWLGQMVASLCWIASVFSYGISSPGDWLQLAAAGSWCVANVAALSVTEGS